MLVALRADVSAKDRRRNVVHCCFGWVGVSVRKETQLPLEILSPQMSRGFCAQRFIGRLILIIACNKQTTEMVGVI